MKKKFWVISGIVIAAGAISAGAWYYMKDGKEAVSDDVVYVTKISTLNEEGTGVQNRFAGVVEPQETVKVEIESGRKVKEVQVKTGEEVKTGQLLFEYDLSSIQDDLKEAQLALDRLKNEAMSLSDQIKTLEKEKKKASKDSQLSYTIEIETNKMNLKKNEYDQKSKEAEITKLQSATTNTEVRSEIDGVIQKIDNSKLTTEDGDSLDESTDYYSMGMGEDGSGENNAFITILSTGAYRIKGKVNEQNKNSIIQGEPVIVRSRVDESVIWHGTMGAIDEQNATSESSNMYNYGMIDSSGDSQTSSSSYPFYVDLESSEGLMLGQHVYIEKDEGQEEKKAGLWLSDFYIVDADTEAPYVWAAGDKGKLEKREIVLGQYDEVLSEYEIADGLTEKDSIAFPEEKLTEGLPTADSSTMPAEDLPEADMGGASEEGVDMEYSDEMPEMVEEGLEGGTDSFTEESMEPIEDYEGGAIDDGTMSEEITDEEFDDYAEDAMDAEGMYGSDDTEAAG